MSYNEREKRRKKRKRSGRIFISIIFLYILFRSVPSLLANSAKTILPERDTLVDNVITQGFIIKNEKVIRADKTGELERFIDEGERLNKGARIASISSMSEGSSLKQELEQIEKSIIALEKSESDTETVMKDIEKAEGIHEELTLELQKSINNENFEDIYILKEKILLSHNKTKEVGSTDTLLSQSLEKLRERKAAINSEVKSNYIDYYADRSGIISYEIDGYEDMYIPNDFENYTYDRLNISNMKNSTDRKERTKNEVKTNEPIYKIIDNFEWHLGIIIEDISKVPKYQNGDKLTIQIEDDDEEISGRIISVNNSGGKLVLIVKLTTGFHEHYNKRFPRVHLIKNKLEGFKIPSKSIIVKDSIEGVYIKDTSGIVRFRPIKIIGEYDEFTYVEIGNSMSQVKLKDSDELIRTISIYDEIFLNTTNIREGQILN